MLLGIYESALERNEGVGAGQSGRRWTLCDSYLARSVEG